MTPPDLTLSFDGYAVWVGERAIWTGTDEEEGVRCLRQAQEVHAKLQALTCRDQDQAFKDMETDSIEQVLEGLSWLQRNQGDRL